MEKKLQEIKSLLIGIKNKVGVLSNNNNLVKVINYKLESLFLVYRTYGVSIPDIVQHEITCNILDNKLCLERQEPAENLHHTEAKVCVPTRKLETMEEFMSRMSPYLLKNRLFALNAQKIVSCLWDHSEGLPLETIIKTSGVTKYKCVNVLNFLGKTDPAFISKRFVRSFIYQLNIL